MKYSLYLFFTFSFIFTQNYSLSFDGIDDYIEIENPDIVFHVNQGLTIKAEVLSEPGASGYLINRYQHGAGNTPNNNFFILYNQIINF